MDICSRCHLPMIEAKEKPGTCQCCRDRHSVVMCYASVRLDLIDYESDYTRTKLDQEHQVESIN